MSLLAPLGLLGLLGIIALIIIYIIKPNYQSKFISSTFIWKLSLKYKKKRIPINKLRNIIIFICQILILTAAAFILAKPYIDNSTQVENGDTILIIDSSASMHTTTGKSTRFSRAVNQVREDASAAFEAGNKVTVILASDKASFIAQQLTADQASLLYEELQRMAIAPENYYTYREPDVKGAMTLAEQITSYTENVAVTFYTDMTYYEDGEVGVYNVCDISEWNAAILDVRATFSEGYYRIEVDVASYGKDENVKVDLEITNHNNSGTSLFLQANAVCTGDNVTTLVFAHMPTDEENNMTDAEKAMITEAIDLDSYDQIFVRLSEQDSLSYDNVFNLYGGNKPTIDVLYYSILPNNFVTTSLLVVQDALKNDWEVKVTEIREGDPVVQGYDVYIFEHKMPKVMPDDGVVICINPKELPSEAGIRFSGSANLGGQEIQFHAGETHPIMNNINAANIFVTSFYTISSYDGYTPLATVGDSSSEYPILLVKDEPGEKVVVMPFSLHYSNLALLPEFPLLMLNTFTTFFPVTTEQFVYESGDLVDLNARGSFLEVTTPSGATSTLQSFPAQIQVEAPGSYTFTQYLMSGDPAVENIYVKIPATESEINLTEATLVNPYFYEEPDTANVDLLFYFALAMVALLFLEWWLKSREQI